MFTDPTPLPVWLIASLLRDVVLRLRGVLGTGNPAHRRASMLLPFYLYSGRVLARLERLFARHEAGTLRPAVARRVRKAEAERKTPRLRLPAQKAWVIDAVGYQAAGVASQLQHLLSRPDAAGLFAMYPQAQAMVRPLCRMLGIAPVGVPALPRRARLRKERPAAGALTPALAARGEGASRRKRLTRKEREAILWYPNSEGVPMKLLPPRLPRD